MAHSASTPSSARTRSGGGLPGRDGDLWARGGRVSARSALPREWGQPGAHQGLCPKSVEPQQDRSAGCVADCRFLSDPAARGLDAALGGGSGVAGPGAPPGLDLSRLALPTSSLNWSRCCPMEPIWPTCAHVRLNVAKRNVCWCALSNTAL